MGEGTDSDASAGSAVVSRFRAGIVAGSICGFLLDAFSTTSPAVEGSAGFKTVVPAPVMGVEGFHSVRSFPSNPSRPELFHSRPSKGKRRSNLGRSADVLLEDDDSLANNSVEPESVFPGTAVGGVSASALGRRHHASLARGRSSVPKAFPASGEAQFPFC